MTDVEAAAEGEPERRDPGAADPEAAARDLAKREGISYEAALADVRASIVKREAALARIRAIRAEGAARIAAMQAAAETQDYPTGGKGEGSA